MTIYAIKISVKDNQDTNMKLNIIIDVFVYMCSAVHSSPTLVASILDRKIDQAQMEYISYAFTHNNRRQVRFLVFFKDNLFFAF